mmetsp:Transcript_22144/g.71534  ORF Transcript_22144/g.71534 Transcript_22144/m.71534 type:complete len:212 (+) Transcript_22144:398-1033(+)|eukprot:scaffold10944_cov110-Isochrysis_galbana.AAC.7
MEALLPAPPMLARNGDSNRASSPSLCPSGLAAPMPDMRLRRPPAPPAPLPDPAAPPEPKRLLSEEVPLSPPKPNKSPKGKPAPAPLSAAFRSCPAACARMSARLTWALAGSSDEARRRSHTAASASPSAARAWPRRNHAVPQRALASMIALHVSTTSRQRFCLPRQRDRLSRHFCSSAATGSPRVPRAPCAPPWTAESAAPIMSSSSHACE